MLYNSFLFIFIFLPACLAGYLLIGRFCRVILPQMLWLVVMSCIFYAHWNKSYLIILLGSLCINFAFGQALMESRSKRLLVWAIAFNLAVLGYFKYRAFALMNVQMLLNLPVHVPSLVLPLGISFFTFQKIAYLVDIYRGRIKESNFLRYANFIAFFPQLIAGPIVHYRPLMRQFPQQRPILPRWSSLGIGFAFFIMGLAKKVVVADNLALYADPLFSAAEAGTKLGFYEAWLAVLTYTFQIYFDFSGYSDMAIGLARMFGIRLPANFNSPYKSRNIIEFWRRWHITLSFFLRDYVYIPLGGNRHGRLRQRISLMATMLLGGLWHGANWTFVLWGGLHGLMLAINHTWQQALGAKHATLASSRLYRTLCIALTFLAAACAWVLFRAPTLTGAMLIFRSMLGLHGFEPQLPDETLQGVIFNLYFRLRWERYHLHAAVSPAAISSAIAVAGTLLFVWLLPNSLQLMRHPECTPLRGPLRALRWKPGAFWLLWLLFLFYVSLTCMAKLDIRPFTYFAF